MLSLYSVALGTLMWPNSCVCFHVTVRTRSVQHLLTNGTFLPNIGHVTNAMNLTPMHEQVSSVCKILDTYNTTF